MATDQQWSYDLIIIDSFASKYIYIITTLFFYTIIVLFANK